MWRDSYCRVESVEGISFVAVYVEALVLLVLLACVGGRVRYLANIPLFYRVLLWWPGRMHSSTMPAPSWWILERRAEAIVTTQDYIVKHLV